LQNSGVQGEEIEKESLYKEIIQKIWQIQTYIHAYIYTYYGILLSHKEK
jgi:hypothetical protein